MPIDDVNNGPKYQSVIDAATNINGLEDAYKVITEAYQRGDISYDAYKKLYAAYEAKHNTPVTQWQWTKPQVTAGIPPGARPEITDPEAGYRRGLAAAGQQTGIGSGELGQYLQSRFNPTFALFGAQGALRGDVGADPTAFEKYAQQTRGAGLGQESLNVFQDLANRARTGKGNMTDEGWAALQPWISPENDTQQGYVSAIAREAAAGKYGGIASRYFMPSNEKLLREWQMGSTGAQSPELLAYLKRAFGL